MDNEELSILYRKALRFVTYIPATGYLWIDGEGNWHGTYELEEQAVSALLHYLNKTDLTPFLK